jgi:hypothetical protein
MTMTTWLLILACAPLSVALAIGADRLMNAAFTLAQWMVRRKGTAHRTGHRSSSTDEGEKRRQ